MQQVLETSIDARAEFKQHNPAFDFQMSIEYAGVTYR
jgi:hypothetical protein